jgi:hypothetical protein
LIFILLLVSLAFGVLAPRLLSDADIGWHIRNGQNILSTHAIPHTDPFSATMSGRTWYAWEWLYDLGIGIVYNRLGLNGVVFVSALLIAAMLSLVFRLALHGGASVPITILLFLLCLGASSIHFLARPHIVGWLITVAWFWILDSTNRKAASYRRLLGLPLLMLLWVNLHGGFILGFMLLGCFLLADMITATIDRDQEQRRQARTHGVWLGAVLALSALASLINPYGYKLHLHVYQYLSNRFFMQHIDEFRRPDLYSLPAVFFLVLLLVAIAGCVMAWRKLRWSELLVVVFSAFLGLYAARNIPIAAMLLTMIAPSFFSRRSTGADEARATSRIRAFATRVTRLELSLRGHLWPFVVVLASAGVCFYQGSLFGRQVMNAHFDEKRFPVQALDSLVPRGIWEPTFSLDSWGGYLIYRLYPGTRVFVDDRHDFYGEPFLRDYLKVLHTEPGWEKVLDGLGANLILIPTKSKLATALRTTPAWRITYTDETATAFERTEKR